MTETRHGKWVIERDFLPWFILTAKYYSLTTINAIANSGESVQIGSADATMVSDTQIGVAIVYQNQEEWEAYLKFAKTWVELEKTLIINTTG